MWRRSSRCDSNACVEVAFGSRHVVLRDSTNTGQWLVVERADWSRFVAGLRSMRPGR